MRLRYRFERSSWSGYRPYTAPRWTTWTTGQAQSLGPVRAPCPSGRRGTYDSRLSVTVEITGTVVGDSAALSDDGYRAPCGTGVS